MKENDEKPRINEGYLLSHLVKAMSQTGELASKKVQQWQDVLRGLYEGTLAFGSRTPVQDVPPWVTLEVIHGGFVTGKFQAGGKLLEHEKALEKKLSVEGRSALNLYFVTDEGQHQLLEMLDSGRYRINVPEEAALLIAAWLMATDQRDRATELVNAIAPYFDQLRFYPIPHERPVVSCAGVNLRTAGETAAALRTKRPQASVAKMKEAIEIWTPLYDRTVSLFMGAVGEAMLSFDPDWTKRARELLEEYEAAKQNHKLCKKHLKPKENFSRLRGFMAKAIEDPKSLNDKDIANVRHILNNYATAHGAQGSERFTETRAMQREIAQAPLHHELAARIADRLAAYAPDEGVENIEEVFDNLQIPVYIKEKTKRCWVAPLKTLVENKIITSGESMAIVLPALTARVSASSIEDPQLARVFEATYRAFRRRRSLLLLNLESQVKFHELPWIAAVEPWVSTSETLQDAARNTLTEATVTSLEFFPYTIFPNPLLKEFRALANAANLRVPLVDELASDIFMGEFSENFLRAAQCAGRLLRGSLYERYYGIDYEAVLAIDDVEKNRYKVPVSAAYSRMCQDLAGLEYKGWDAARSGCILEQSQILTTHNLASLFEALRLEDALKEQLPQMARDCFDWICHRQQLHITEWRAELQNIKNCAYAWRQMMFFLSFIDERELKAFVQSTESTHTNALRIKLTPAVRGLELVADGGRFDLDGTGENGARRFLGWSLQRHWLRPPLADTANK